MGFVENCSNVVTAGWYEDQGRRNEMEDGFIYIDNFGDQKGCTLMGIYDGHGGRQTVENLENHLHNDLLEEIIKGNQNIYQCFCEAFKTTDERICNENACGYSGSTACIGLLVETKEKKLLYCAHVGDARIVLCRDGIAIRLTSESDHKANNEREQLFVLDRGGIIFNERVNGVLAITRSFGDTQLKQPLSQQNIISIKPDVVYTTIDENKNDLFIILACDGLWDVIDDQSAVNIVLESLDALISTNAIKDNQVLGELLAHVLVEEALLRGSGDNITVMVVIF